ncbi:MAG: response regulator [Treponema sp.]|nr:response regulator [Treponema sp.]MCL2250883.1 response regulator [Treponema sp.]
MKTIFVVDDNNVNLVSADEALSKHYRIFTLPSAASMFELLEDIRPDLILLDILMPDMDGFETLKQLKETIHLADIPVIFLTSRTDASTEALGFEMGVVDFISKPFSRPVLLNRIKIHLGIEDIIHERTDSLMKLKNGILSVLANMVENRDGITGKHIERTTYFIRLLLKVMIEKKVYFDEISQWDLELAISSARLHDIGKITITDLILNKPGNLSVDEFDTIKTHVAEGERIIDRIMEESGDEAFLQYAKLFAGYHHEKWDGSGYPYGLNGENIPLQGRIMAIADVYDALVSKRSYKPALSHAEAVDIILKNSGKHFDPDLIKVFLLCEKDFEKAGSE